MNYREKMKEHLKEPDEHSSQWGRWGILNKEQRDLIKRLLREMDSADVVIKNQFEENEKLKELCKKYEEEHKTTFEEWKKTINIINTMLDFNFFKEECPLNFGYTEKCDEEKAQDVFYEDDYCEENCNDDYKKCWLKYFERLQELKGVDKE